MNISGNKLQVIRKPKYLNSFVSASLSLFSDHRKVELFKRSQPPKELIMLIL